MITRSISLTLILPSIAIIAWGAIAGEAARPVGPLPAQTSCQLIEPVQDEPSPAPDSARISPATQTEDGVRVHSVVSPLQNAETEIRVVLPKGYSPEKRYPVIYLLPVEAKRESRYGDSVDEVLKHRLHHRHDVVFVAPTFSELPWYADHPTRPDCRQEQYFVNVVVPFIRRTYSVSPHSRDQLLLGFSKSGWGAWSLLLRSPERFGRAAAWDAPLMMQQLGKYGTGPIFGTEANLEEYRITGLLDAQAATLRQSSTPRLIHLGYGNFRDHHERIQKALVGSGIPAHYQDGPQRKHDWHSGWVPEAVALLLNSD